MTTEETIKTLYDAIDALTEASRIASNLGDEHWQLRRSLLSVGREFLEAKNHLAAEAAKR